MTNKSDTSLLQWVYHRMVALGEDPDTEYMLQLKHLAFPSDFSSQEELEGYDELEEEDWDEEPIYIVR